MKRITLALTAMTLLGTLSAFARTECAVLAQDPTNPHSYNKVLQMDLDVQFKDGEGKIIYQTDKMLVAVSKSAQGNLGVSSIQMPGSELAAAATGGLESVYLVDGANKISIVCSKK